MHVYAENVRQMDRETLWTIRLLLVQGSNTGQDLALQQLQGGTACMQEWTRRS